MYKELQGLLNVAEGIGTLTHITMSESRGWIDMEGETPEGVAFHITLSLEGNR